MEPIRKITNFDGLQQQSEITRSLPETAHGSRSYAAAVGEILTKSRAGIAQQLSDEEFDFTVDSWVEVLYGHVPEARLNDAYVHASRTRSSTFPLTQYELCDAWNQIRTAERNAPPIGTYDYRGREVCPDCNDTGTKLIVKRDLVLGRDYTYGVPCDVILSKQ